MRTMLGVIGLLGLLVLLGFGVWKGVEMWWPEKATQLRRTVQNPTTPACNTQISKLEDELQRLKKLLKDQETGQGQENKPAAPAVTWRNITGASVAVITDEEAAAIQALPGDKNEEVFQR